jgi:hypothetical protein
MDLRRYKKVNNRKTLVKVTALGWRDMGSPCWCDRNQQRKIKDQTKLRKDIRFVEKCNGETKIQVIPRPSTYSVTFAISLKERIRKYSKPYERTQKGWLFQFVFILALKSADIGYSWNRNSLIIFIKQLRNEFRWIVVLLNGS